MWVHDYHLMLMPKILSDFEKVSSKERQTSIIFFLHIPFPTSQIFRYDTCISVSFNYLLKYFVLNNTLLVWTGVVLLYTFIEFFKNIKLSYKSQTTGFGREFPPVLR